MKISVLLFLFISMQMWCYSNQVKFGKVSKEEIAQTQHPLENDADAAILYKKERVFYDFNYDKGWFMTKEVHYRVKIYNKEGLNWATIQVPLYISNGEEEKISGVKGITFNLENEKITEEKLKKDGIFIESVNKYRNKASIAMPGAKEGSVLDIEYKITSPLYWHMDDFWFQYKIPVNNVDIRLDIPQYFVFKKYSRGFYPIQINEYKENRNISVSYRTEDQSGQLGRTSRRNGSIEFFENVYEVNATNLPSLQEEAFTNNIDNYRTAIKFELASTQFPNSAYKNYSLTWEGVAKSIYDFSGFGTELKKTKYFEEDIDNLIAGTSDKMEKAMLIFDHVKSKMTWDDFYGVTCSADGVKKAYKEGSGNVAEINLMLTSMFRHAGLNANPILVSTRSHGIPLFPTTDGFNYVISGIEVQDDVILFDATEKNSYPDVLPNRALNWMGRLVRKDGSSSQVNLIPSKLSKEIHHVTAKINPDGSVNGKSRTQYFDQFALMVRDRLDNKDEESYLDDIESQYGDMEIISYDFKNKKKFSKPLIETCEFNKDDQCEIIGEKIYFEPMLFLAQEQNPFKMDNREYPVDFTFPRQKKYMIGVTIPEGYQVEVLPESAVVQMPEGMGGFTYKIAAQGNQISIMVSSMLKSAIFPSEYYGMLKEYYKNLVSKESEKVVLSKI
ncbi:MULTISPECIES: transglutaminase domain-containing protein [Flavobacteriaceae]|uniref:transglutaminase domain-containing protein n=1 Tax=Flavobacteriaceae TaxID=49546 RepID=UPI0014926A57|nr:MULTISPECIES: transglutaminase domain-containing protein [Allomuricauda]MDC6365824.1 transglutaminase [Muricauda sp. AC10]